MNVFVGLNSFWIWSVVLALLSTNVVTSPLLCSSGTDCDRIALSVPDCWDGGSCIAGSADASAAPALGRLASAPVLPGVRLGRVAVGAAPSLGRLDPAAALLCPVSPGNVSLSGRGGDMWYFSGVS